MWGWGWPCFDKTVLCFLMEIMHKNNMIYIGKQICLYLKNKVNSNLVSIYYCKMGYSKYLHEGPKKKCCQKLCWQLDKTNIYITKSLITMNNILCPTNSKTYGKEPQNDGSFLVLWMHAIIQWWNTKDWKQYPHHNTKANQQWFPWHQKTPDLTKPCYTEDILPVSWPFIILRFYSK